MYQNTYLVDKNSIHDICDALRYKLKISDKITFSQILPLLKSISLDDENSGTYIPEGIVNIVDLQLYYNKSHYDGLNGTTTDYYMSSSYSSLNHCIIINNMDIINNLPSEFLYNNTNIGSPAGTPVYKYYGIENGNMNAYIYCKNNIVFSDTCSAWYNSLYSGKGISAYGAKIHNIGNEYAKYMYHIGNGFNSYSLFGENFGYSCGKYTTNMLYGYYYSSSTLPNDTFKCGDNVIDFRQTYYMAQNTIATPVIGPNVVAAQACYDGCSNAIGDVDFSKATNCSQFYLALGYCCNINSVKLPIFNTTRANLLSFASGCTNLHGNIVVRSRKADFDIECHSMLGETQWISHVVLYCSHYNGALGLSANNYFRTNIYFNNYSVYDDFIGSKSKSATFDFSDDSTDVDISEIQIDDLLINPVRYKYNSIYNVYAYCTE